MGLEDVEVRREVQDAQIESRKSRLVDEYIDARKSGDRASDSVAVIRVMLGTVMLE